MKLLVAERFNMPRCAKRTREWKALDTQTYIERALSYGALWHDQKMKMIGVTWDDSLNLLPPGERGDPWDKRMARRIASAIDVSKYERVWLVGLNVASAFGLGHLSLLESEGKHTVVPPPAWYTELNMEVAKNAIHKLLVHS